MVRAWKKTGVIWLDGKTFVWDIKCCPFPPYTDVFAAVAGCEVHILRIDLETSEFHRLASCTIKSEQQTAEQDQYEILYTCEWMRLSNGAFYILAGGEHGNIWILNSETLTCERVLQGHGKSIVRVLEAGLKTALFSTCFGLCSAAVVI
jgi:WD40 repeat protein